MVTIYVGWPTYLGFAVRPMQGKKDSEVGIPSATHDNHILHSHIHPIPFFQALSLDLGEVEELPKCDEVGDVGPVFALPNEVSNYF